MSAKDNAKIARRMYDLWNDRDFDAQLAECAENVEWVDVPGGGIYRDREGYRQFLQRWAAAFPDGRCEVVRVVADDDGAAVEFIGRGTHNGPLTTPAGDVAPTGRRMELRFCDFAEIRNGKVVSGRTYYDAAGMMRQLGMLPEMAMAGTQTSSARMPM